MGYFSDLQSGEIKDTESTSFVSNINSRRCSKCNSEVFLSFKYKKSYFCYKCTNPSKMELDRTDLNNYYMNKVRWFVSGNSIYLYGIWFRSKFERDFFQLFNHLGFEIWYEHLSFKKYLPDFYLPEYKIWVETRGYDERKDLMAFEKNIRLGMFEGSSFENVPEAIDHVETDITYYQKHGDIMSSQDIVFFLEQAKKAMITSALDRYITLIPMKSSKKGQHNYEDGDSCSILNDHKGNQSSPIIAYINEKWNLISQIDYKDKKSKITDAYYLYYYFNELNNSSKIFLKSVKGNNKIWSKKFIESI